MGSNGPSDGWGYKALELVVAPVITGLVVSISLLVLGPMIADRWEVRKATCEDPRGVLLVDAEELMRKKQLSIKVSSTQPGWSKDKLVDGITETVWVPKDEEARGAQVTKENGSSWIFEPFLTWANAVQRVQCSAFSLVRSPSAHPRTSR
jgi:hypothetical protein